MAKWYGKVGYATTVETEPGIWEETIVERDYYGDVISNRYKRQNSGDVNDNINLAISISIVADPFAYQHCANMAYVEYMGAKWKVTDIDPNQRPRLILTIGGVYNGEQA
mgnify:FL=1